MKLKIYQIDAFTKTIFGGNPAAVVPLESWLDDAVMQKIAEEKIYRRLHFLRRRAAVLGFGGLRPSPRFGFAGMLLWLALLRCLRYWGLAAIR
jgi:hypothetical protein